MQRARRIAVVLGAILIASRGVAAQGTIVPLTGDGCAGSATPSDPTYTPPESNILIVPPLSESPLTVHNLMFVVRFHVGASGAPDSLQFGGVDGIPVSKKFRDTMMGYRFRPAFRAGCAVPAMYSISLIGGRPRWQGPVRTDLQIAARGWPQMTSPPWIESAPRPADPTRRMVNLVSGCGKLVPSLEFGHLPDPGSEGVVVLRFVVDSTGAPVDSTVRVLESSGPEFTASIRKVFSTFHYSPAQCDGAPTAVDLQQTFRFSR